jgi:type II secretory pathway pseudopilin PulG
MKKFTIIELICIIAIVCVLFSILYPSLTLARAKTQTALCKTNLKQFGIAARLYVTNNNDIYPIFRNGTCDAPHEGDSRKKGKIAPGNPALWTFEYLGTPEVYSCPLVETDQKFVIDPKEKNNGLWGTYAYLFKKVPNSEDPYRKYRNGVDAENNIISKVNEKSENILFVDFPDENAKIWYPNYNWKTTYTHFNVLMLDNSSQTTFRELISLNTFLWNKTSWYD